MATKRKSNKASSNGSKRGGNGATAPKTSVARVNRYGIPDWRLEHPEFEVVEIAGGPEVHYEIRGKLDSAVPPIRESKYLTREQHLELYRWMVMNRRMEQALENLYKQSQV